ncbi:hypothetical protein TWF718_003949 [Orbilia javanica]|uniref:Uncharacterized protein n=1 Tax=Orbilia javanica TaxID=47235 RepID=A0AAN8N5H2_9PEZI
MHMHTPTLKLLLTLSLSPIPSVNAWSYLFWQTPPPSDAAGNTHYGSKVTHPPLRCHLVSENTQPRGLTITQFGEQNLLVYPERSETNNRWLDPVRYIGLWYNVRKRCEGLPDVIIRYYPDVYTSQTVDFQKLGEYVPWVKDASFKFAGEIPFGDQDFGGELVPGDVAVRNSKPPFSGVGSYRTHYVVVSNAVAVTVIRAGLGLGVSDVRWQTAGEGTFTRGATFTLPPEKMLTGQLLDRGKEVKLGYVPEKYPAKEPSTNPPGGATTAPNANPNTMAPTKEPEETKDLNHKQLNTRLEEIQRSQQQILNQIAQKRAQQPQQQQGNMNTTPYPLHPLLYQTQKSQPPLTPDQLANQASKWVLAQWPRQQKNGASFTPFTNYMDSLNAYLLKMRQYHDAIQQRINHSRRLQQWIRYQMFSAQQLENIPLPITSEAAAEFSRLLGGNNNQGQSLSLSPPEQPKQQPQRQQIRVGGCTCPPEYTHLITKQNPAQYQVQSQPANRLSPLQSTRRRDDRRPFIHAPINSLNSPEENPGNTGITTNDLNHSLANYVWEELEKANQLKITNEARKGKEAQEAALITRKPPSNAVIQTILQLFNTQKDNKKPITGAIPGQTIFDVEQKCICPMTSQSTTENINSQILPQDPEAIPSSEAPASQYINRVLQKAEDEREERRKLNRQAAIDKSRTARLAELERTNGGEINIENQEDTIGTRLPGGAIEEELPADDLITRILIEEDDVQQGQPDFMVKEDEGYDPNLLAMGGSLYEAGLEEDRGDVEPKEEEVGSQDVDIGSQFAEEEKIEEGVKEEYVE